MKRRAKALTTDSGAGLGYLARLDTQQVEAPKFNTTAPPADWERQHAGPHGYYRMLANRVRVIWLPGGRPVPRAAGNHGLAPQQDYGYATRCDSGTFLFA
jgi:hypothetical protein